VSLTFLFLSQHRLSCLTALRLPSEGIALARTLYVRGGDQLLNCRRLSVSVLCVACVFFFFSHFPNAVYASAPLDVESLTCTCAGMGEKDAAGQVNKSRNSPMARFRFFFVAFCLFSPHLISPPASTRLCVCVGGGYVTFCWFLLLFSVS
jgi:hypothetical protein